MQLIDLATEHHHFFPFAEEKTDQLDHTSPRLGYSLLIVHKLLFLADWQVAYDRLELGEPVLFFVASRWLFGEQMGALRGTPHNISLSLWNAEL